MKRMRKASFAKAIVQQPGAQIDDRLPEGIQARARVADYRMLPSDVKTALPGVQQLKNIVPTPESSDA